MEEQEIAEELLDFIWECKSPFQTVQVGKERLQEAGFEELFEAEAWEIHRGGKYFVSFYDTTLFAFVVGGQDGALRMAAAHTDFPCFRVKSNPEMEEAGCGLLNVEPYGGIILRTWLDRPLAIAGKVVLRGEDAFHPRVSFVDSKRAILTIPSLAIHMEREVNEKGALNPQKDMLPMATLLSGMEEEKEKDFFLSWLAREMQVRKEEILSYELSTYPAEEGCTLGLAEDMISSARLDNLTSMHAALCALTALKAGQIKGIRLGAFFDHEEVGSRTKQGAGSTLLPALLGRIYRTLEKTEDDLLRDVADGFLLSLDVAHAVHPLHRDKADPTHEVKLGAGVVIKQAASQSYAGDAEAVATVRLLAEEAGVPVQLFTNRADMRGGSTLGSIASAILPVRTMDIGVPVLAMHSARETMALADQAALNLLLRNYFI